MYRGSGSKLERIWPVVRYEATPTAFGALPADGGAATELARAFDRLLENVEIDELFEEFLVDGDLH